MNRILLIVLSMVMGGAPRPQTPPVIFHAVNCVTKTADNNSTQIQTCQVYLTGGSGDLWPKQADNVTMSTMPKYSGDTITDGVLPQGYTVDSKGLNMPANPVGACNCGRPAMPAPPELLGIQVAKR